VIVNCETNKEALSGFASQLSKLQKSRNLDARAMQALVEQTNQLVGSLFAMGSDLKIVRAGVEELLAKNPRLSTDSNGLASRMDDEELAARYYATGLSYCGADRSKAALGMFKRAADLNFPAAQYAYAIVAYFEWAVGRKAFPEEIRHEARKALFAAAASSYPAALRLLSRSYDPDPAASEGRFFRTVRSSDLSKSYLWRAAQGGDAFAQNSYGASLRYQDRDEAMLWFRRSARLGCPLGSLNQAAVLETEGDVEGAAKIRSQMKTRDISICWDQFFNPFNCEGHDWMSRADVLRREVPIRGWARNRSERDSPLLT
jgi:tetratricopeptide (TPR) repeat protein